MILIYNSDIMYNKYIKPKFIIWYKKEFQMSKNVHIISHSHWDREWYLPFESTQNATL